MAAEYIPRAIEPVLRRAVRQFPALLLSGPRQSGKTTVLKHLFGTRARYVSLEPPDVRATAASDPRGFLDYHRPPVIFDEVQFAPGLLPYIKELIDEQRNKAGQFLLTGSQNLLLMEQTSETLAGRAAVMKLLPLSWREQYGVSEMRLPWERGSFDGKRSLSSTKSVRRWGSSSRQVAERIHSASDSWKKILRGGFPELASSPDRDSTLWHSSYVQTYLERDVRTLRQVGDLTLFQSFLRLLATRSGQLLNLSDLGRDLGVATNTAKAWLSVLEASYQIIILRPYLANLGKRLVKAPKVYFTDSGTLCHLVGLKEPEHAMSSPMTGSIFETTVMGEVLKTLLHRGEEPRLYFWRTAKGVEVDLLVESSQKLIPIEIKASATPRPEMARGIKSFQADFPDRASPGFVIHGGDTRLPLGPRVTAVPFGQL